MSSTSMIKLDALTKTFTTDEVETTALNAIDLEIDAGEFLAVMGPSGCGKSTLLNILLGQSLSRCSEGDLTAVRKANIGFVFQNFNLIDNLSVFENVELPLFYQGMAKPKRRELVDEQLAKLGIAHRRDHFPRQLSGGQQQRTAVARAIVSSPKLILADEPTGNLDSSNGNDVMSALVQLNQAGTTIVMVTHSEHDAKFAGRVVRLADGKIAA
ncbi:MAG: phosphonate transporter ATP-binding protein [Polyangiaceae bacterium]|nr:phosphonate transporter ATP-binding protein [Polyangiaceae bacterium]